MLTTPLLLTLLAGAAVQEPRTADDAEFRQRETALFAAVRDRDAAALEALLAPDYVLRGNPDVARDVWIANAISLCWGEADLDRLRVQRLDGTAVVAFLLTFDRDPETCRPATLQSLITDVWRREADGAWRLAVRHSGPPGTGGGLAAQFGLIPILPPVFEARSELSLVSTGGNASTRSLGVRADLTHRGARATTTGRLTFLRSEADAVENARALAIDARQSWRLTRRSEVFGRGEYLRDLFAGIEHRAIAEGGLSYSPLAAPHALRLDVGLGSTREVRLDVPDRRFASSTIAAVYTWSPSTVSELLAQSAVTSDLQRRENWRSSNEVSLIVSLTRVLATRLAYSLRYLNEPVPGFRRTDTTASAALVLSYARRNSP